MHLISTIQRIFRKEKLDTLAANIRPYYIQAGRCPQPHLAPLRRSRRRDLHLLNFNFCAVRRRRRGRRVCSRRSPTASPLTRSSLSSSMSLPLAPALLLLGLTGSVPIGQLKRMLLKTRNAASLELYYRRNPRPPPPSAYPFQRAPIRFECPVTFHVRRLRFGDGARSVPGMEAGAVDLETAKRNCMRSTAAYAIVQVLAQIVNYNRRDHA